MLFEIDRIGFFDGLLGFGGRVFVMKLGSVVTCQWVVEMPAPKEKERERATK